MIGRGTVSRAPDVMLLVDVYVRQLRKKIDEGNPLKLLRTVRGVGYSISEEGA